MCTFVFRQCRLSRPPHAQKLRSAQKLAAEFRHTHGAQTLCAPRVQDVANALLPPVGYRLSPGVVSTPYASSCPLISSQRPSFLFHGQRGTSRFAPEGSS